MAKRLGLSLVLAILTGICEAQAEGPNLWTIEITYDKKVPEPAVPIYINDEFQGQGNLLVLHYQVSTQKGWSWPAVFALYSSGYFRLAPATNPPTNFGTSAILGPAYWSNGNYYHNPTLSEIRLSGDMKRGQELLIKTGGRLGDLEVEYIIKVKSPTLSMMNCQVYQKAQALKEFKIDEAHLANHEGWKLAQLSSMFIDGELHDADAVHFAGKTRRYLRTNLSNSTGFVFNQTDRLDEAWLELAHFARTGWQGATPSMLIVLEDFALARDCSPQGWVAQTDDRNNDNVGAWVNWDVAPLQWSIGQSQGIKYWLMARDQPRIR